MGKRIIRKQRKGAVLALMVMIILLLSMTSLALIKVGQEARLRTVRNASEIAARFAADAGIEQVIYQMNKQLAAGTWTLDNIPVYTAQRMSGCAADYTVTYSGSLAGGYQITSAGRCGGQIRTVRATIGLTSPFAENYAVLTQGNMAFKNKSIVRGYNSADPLDTEVEVRIGTLSTDSGAVDIYNGSSIDADIYVGPNGDPRRVVNQHGGAKVAGEYFVMPVKMNLPVIEPPDYVASRGSLLVNHDLELHASDSGKYTSINVKNGKTLIIGGDLTLYVTGNIDLGNGAKIEVEDKGSLKLYFNGSLDARNSAGISNRSQIPSKVKLYGTGTNQKIDLKNDGALYGVVYAPQAQMTVHNETDVYGSIIVDDFELKNGGNIYYDEALKNVSLNDEGIRFAVTRWEDL